MHGYYTIILFNVSHVWFCVCVHTHSHTHALARSFHYMPGKRKMWMPKSRHCQQRNTCERKKKIQKQYNGFSRFGTCLINLVAFHFIVIKKDSIKVDTRKKDYTILFNDLIFWFFKGNREMFYFMRVNGFL